MNHTPLDLSILPPTDRANRKGEAGHSYSYSEGVTITVLKQNQAYLVEIDAEPLTDKPKPFEPIDIELTDIPRWYGAKEYNAVLDYAGQVLMTNKSHTPYRGLVIAINQIRTLSALETLTQDATPITLPYRQSRESINHHVQKALMQAHRQYYKDLPQPK